MPDILGLAIAIAALYFLLRIDKGGKNLIIGALLVGLLAGTRLSYLPLLVIPLVYIIIVNHKRIYIVAGFLFGCMVWLIPLTWITGINDLIMVSEKQTFGHFSDFGGTVITENDWFIRIKSFVRSIWSDGLGGYWSKRSWVTIILSFSMIYIGYYGVRGMIESVRKEHAWKMILFSLLMYTIWVFFFQNVIYKSRHILPILIILLMFFTMGQKNIPNIIRMSGPLIGIFFVSLIFVTSVLVSQHSKPTAIAKLKDSIINSPDNNTIISIPLINYYLRKNGVNANFINIYRFNQLERDRKTKLNGAMVIGNFNEIFSSEFVISPDTVLYHNPYVNRMWSEIPIFRLSKKVD